MSLTFKWTILVTDALFCFKINLITMTDRSMKIKSLVWLWTLCTGWICKKYPKYSWHNWLQRCTIQPRSLKTRNISSGFVLFCFVLFCYLLFFFYVKDLLDLLVTEMSRLSSEGINVYFSLTLFDQWPSLQYLSLLCTFSVRHWRMQRGSCR